jgi:hypothetical protein
MCMKRKDACKCIEKSAMHEIKFRSFVVFSVHEYIKSLEGCDALVDRLALDSNKVSNCNVISVISIWKRSLT